MILAAMVWVLVLLYLLLLLVDVEFMFMAYCVVICCMDVGVWAQKCEF